LDCSCPSLCAVRTVTCAIRSDCKCWCLSYPIYTGRNQTLAGWRAGHAAAHKIIQALQEARVTETPPGASRCYSDATRLVGAFRVPSGATWTPPICHLGMSRVVCEWTQMPLTSHPAAHAPGVSGPSRFHTYATQMPLPCHLYCTHTPPASVFWPGCPRPQ
jgi:hypothetical protein